MTKTARAVTVRDMTQGNIYRLILGFTLPLLIGNLFHQFYIIADTMVVGYHLGDEAIAAIGATSSLYSLIFFFSRALNNGYAIIVTQRFGSKNIPEMKKAIAAMMILDVAITLLISAAVFAALPALMTFLNIPDSIFRMSYAYTAILVCGLIFVIGYNMFASILMAMGNSRVTLYFLVFSSVTNVALDLLLVAVFSMGIVGAAVATVVSQLLSVIGCGYYALRYYREYFPGRKDFLVPRKLLAELLAMGISLALMSCLVDLGSVIFQRGINLLGQRVITAYSASRKILQFLIEPQGCLSAAIATFTAQNYGAKQYRRIREGIRKVVLMEVGWGFLAMGLVFLFGSQLLRFTTGSGDTHMISHGVLSLRIHFSMVPFLGVLFCMRNAMQAMGMKTAPVLSSCIELLMKLSSALFLIPVFGFVGACLTEPISWVLMALFLIAVYLKKQKTLLPE